MTNTTAILDADISDQIRQLCQQGYQLFDAGDAKTALRRFYSAWTLIPKPQTQWQQAGWVLTALGDVYFSKGDYTQGVQALLSALHCPHAIGNPVIHLRLGQCQWELGEHGAAAQQFEQVVKNGGEQLLKQENKKYFTPFEHPVNN